MNNNELYHHGVKGMRWGHRKAQPTTSVDRAKAAYKSAKKDYNKAFDSAYGYSSRHAIGQYVNKDKKAESNKRWGDAYDKAKALDSAKSAYKNEKKAAKIKAVKDYSKTMDAATKMTEAADAKWAEVKQKRMAMGKNAVSRFINAAKGTSKASKEYSKAFDQASRMSDAADAKTREAKEKYKKTGRNAVTRILNNARYDRPSVLTKSRDRIINQHKAPTVYEARNKKRGNF